MRIQTILKLRMLLCHHFCKNTNMPHFWLEQDGCDNKWISNYFGFYRTSPTGTSAVVSSRDENPVKLCSHSQMGYKTFSLS